MEQSRTMSDSQKPQELLNQSLNPYPQRSQNVNINFNERIQENPVNRLPTSQHMGSYYYPDFQQHLKQLPSHSNPLQAPSMSIPRTFPNPNSQDWAPNLAQQNQFPTLPDLMRNPATNLQSSGIQQDYQRFKSYNSTTPGNHPISAAQHFSDNFDYQSQSNVQSGIHTFKGLPSQQDPFVGQSSSFH
jgi:hypothetical protein